MDVLKKKYPIRDENNQPSTYPTFASQVFGDGEDSRALWQADRGFVADDSDKFGGKAPEYYIQPRNLLDNSDFRNPIAQAGVGANHGSTLHLFDRWKCYVMSSATQNDGYITINEGKMWQRVLGLDATKTYTFAVKSTDGNIKIITGSPFSELASGADWGIVENDGIPCFGIGVGAWEWACLYEGSYTAETLPPYVPKGYGVELAECKRYYNQTWDGGTKTLNGMVLREAFTTARLVGVELPCEMRTVPTITLYNTVNFTPNTVSDYITDAIVGDVSPIYTNTKAFIPAQALSNFTQGKIYCFHYSASADL